MLFETYLCGAFVLRRKKGCRLFAGTSRDNSRLEREDQREEVNFGAVRNAISDDGFKTSRENVHLQ